MQRYRNACSDLTEALTAYKLWIHLGHGDIRQRYRGSILGPIWITMTMVIFITALSVVYSRLFHQPLVQYIPFLTCGILIWTYISSTISESTEIFLNAKDLIENMKVPYFLFIFRMLCRNILVFFHNFVVYILVIIIFHIPINSYTLLAIPGFCLVTLNLMAISIFTSLVGTRFRDLPPIINAMITVIFFVSPVTWQANLVGENSLIIRINPVSYFLDLIRSPLLGQLPHIASVYFCLIFTGVLFAVAFAVFAYNSKKIAFWL